MKSKAPGSPLVYAAAFARGLKEYERTRVGVVKTARDFRAVLKVMALEIGRVSDGAVRIETRPLEGEEGALVLSAVGESGAGWPLARVDFSRGGYPLSFTYARREVRCYRRSEIRAALVKLVAHPASGEAFSALLLAPRAPKGGRQ